MPRTSVPIREFIASLPEEEQAEIHRGAAERLREYNLRQVREAIRKTQKEVAVACGIDQADVSRLERRGETAQVATLQRYIRALGGELELVARFPAGDMRIALQGGRPVASRVSADR